jgi:hypothetical protein
LALHGGGKDTVPIVQEAGCAPGLVLTPAENLDHPAHSQSQLHLQYPNPQNSKKVINIIIKVYTGLHIMILAMHILTIQEEDAKPCM